MRRTNRRKFLAGTVGTGLTVGLGGCLGDDDGEPVGDGVDDGVDDGEPSLEDVFIGGIYDMSGPTEGIGAPYGRGAVDGMQYIIDEGIVESLDFEWSDYHYEVEEARTLYTDYVHEGAPGLIGWGTADTEALAPQAAADEVVYLSASSSTALLADETPYNFFSIMDYTSVARAGLDFIEENDPGAKVSFMYPQTAFGTGILDGAKSWLDDKDLEEGSDLVLNIGDASAESQLRGADDEDVDYIFHQSIASPNLLLMQELNQLDFDITVLGMAFTFDEITMKPNQEAFEGHYFLNNTTPFRKAVEEETRGGEAMVQAIEDYRDGDLENWDNANVLYTRGFSHAIMMAEAIQHTRDEGRDVTGANLRQAMFEMSPTDLWGLVREIDFQEGRHLERRPTDTCDIYQVQDGNFVLDDSITLPEDAWDDLPT